MMRFFYLIPIAALLILQGCGTTFATHERSKDVVTYEKKYITVLFQLDSIASATLNPIDRSALLFEFNKGLKKYSIQTQADADASERLSSDYVLILTISEAEMQSFTTYQRGVKISESMTKIPTGKIKWKAYFLKADAKTVSVSKSTQRLIISNNKNKDDVIKTIWVGASGDMKFSAEQYVEDKFSKLYAQLADAVISQLANEKIIGHK